MKRNYEKGPPCFGFVRFVQTLLNMALIKSVRGFTPAFGNDCYLAENATIIGDVVAGDQCSFWFQAVVRGDVHRIRLGHRVNVQDHAVIHCTYQRAPTTIGDDVSIGHRAIVHGCTVLDNVLIGMGAIVMDNAVVKSNSIIAAGAVVLQGTVIESGAIYAGMPAKKVKDASPEMIESIKKTNNNYLMYSEWFK